MSVKWEFSNDIIHPQIREKTHICIVAAPRVSEIPIIHPTCLVCWFGSYSAILSAIFAAYKLVQLILDFFLLFFQIRGAQLTYIYSPELSGYSDEGREQVDIKTILIATKNK